MYNLQWYIRFFKWLIPVYGRKNLDWLSARNAYLPERARMGITEERLGHFIHYPDRWRTLVIRKVLEIGGKLKIGLVLRITK